MGCNNSKKAANVAEPGNGAGAAAPEKKPVEPADVDVSVLDDGAATPSTRKRKSVTKRRAGVSAETWSAGDAEAYVQVVNPKDDASKARIREIISKAQDIGDDDKKGSNASALFANLNAGQVEQVVEAMAEVKVKDGEPVITQGDVGDNFYIIDKGNFEVFLKAKGDMPVHKYNPGDSFGELAIMYNCPRAATVKAKGDGCTCFALDRKSFRHIVLSSNKEEQGSLSRFLKSVQILSPLTDEQRAELATALQEKSYKDGDYIVTKGEVSDALYFIKSGEVVCHMKEAGGAEAEDLMRLTQGQCFGESALSGEAGDVRKANVVAVGSNVKCLKLSTESFQQMMGSLQDVMNKNFNQKVVNCIPLLNPLTQTERDELVEKMTETSFTDGTEIITQGDTGNAFYIIKTGTVKVSSVKEGVTKELASLKSGDYFGERALLKDEPRMATVKAEGSVTCMALDRKVFVELLGPLQSLIDREMQRREQQLEAAKKPEIKFEDLEMRTILGVGTFGRVKLVRHRPTNTPYALKCLRKGQVMALKQVEHVINEKNILAMCDHPFLLKLAGTYQDKDELYMLMELALGGELFTVLRERNKFDEPQSRFYCAVVVSAFEYLHDRKIVYRDLKPENLLLDSEGFLKVVDFGFAKIIQDRTWTLCGTPEYLAPEIISNKGHNLGVDWWALGILLYEMIAGYPPFCADDPMEIYQKILRGKVSYPMHFSKNSKDLISKLLVQNPAARLGCLKRSSRDVKAHPFFKSLDWQALDKKEIKAPMVPTIKDPLDTSNFEQYDEDDDEDWSRFNDTTITAFEDF